jgi:hypothetical protein
MFLPAYSTVVFPRLACAECICGASCVCTKQRIGESAMGASPPNASLGMFPVGMLSIRTVNLDGDLDTVLHRYFCPLI